MEMTFLSGFFLVNFLPAGLIVLAGVLLFFKGNYRRKKWYYPLLLIVIVLGVISLWRIPLLIDRRYAMPTMVPGIVIIAFAFMILPGILNKFKVPYANAITKILIVVLLTVCAVKAMRVQENKDYLHDIPEAIKLDCQKNNINGRVVLLVFGNTGGYLEPDNNVRTINVDNRHLNDRFADVEYQFTQLETADLNPDGLKIQYSHLYLLCTEQKEDSFCAAWKKKFTDTPELIFEYINRKQTAYRLYRVKSPYTGMATDESERMLANKNSLFKNGDLKKKYRISPENDAAKILRDRGINLFENGEVYLPEGWIINPYHSWTANCSPVSIKFTEGDTNALNVQSKDWISIYSDDMLGCNKFYLLAVQANSETQGRINLYAYTYTETAKFIRTILLKEIPLANKKNKYLIYFQLKDCKKIRLALAFSGNVTIDNIKVVSVEANTAPNGIQ